MTPDAWTGLALLCAFTGFATALALCYAVSADRNLNDRRAYEPVSVLSPGFSDQTFVAEGTSFPLDSDEVHDVHVTITSEGLIVDVVRPDGVVVATLPSLWEDLADDCIKIPGVRA